MKEVSGRLPAVLQEVWSSFTETGANISCMLGNFKTSCFQENQSLPLCVLGTVSPGFISDQMEESNERFSWHDRYQEFYDPAIVVTTVADLIKILAFQTANKGGGRGKQNENKSVNKLPGHGEKVSDISKRLWLPVQYCASWICIEGLGVSHGAVGELSIWYAQCCLSSLLPN